MASLGHSGRRRVVLGHILHTQTLTKTDEQKTGFKSIYDFVLGCLRSHPGPCVACGPWAGHPWTVIPVVCAEEVLVCNHCQHGPLAPSQPFLARTTPPNPNLTTARILLWPEARLRRLPTSIRQNPGAERDSLRPDKCWAVCVEQDIAVPRRPTSPQETEWPDHHQHAPPSLNSLCLETGCHHGNCVGWQEAERVRELKSLHLLRRQQSSV